MWQKFLLPVCSALTLSLGGGAVRAETVLEQANRSRQELIDLLETQLKQDGRDVSKRENSPEVNSLRAALREVDNAWRQLSSHPEESVLLGLMLLEENGNLSAASRAIVGKLVAKVQAEQLESSQAYLVRVQAVCRQVGEVAAQAKQAADLDEVLQEVVLLTKDRSSVASRDGTPNGLNAARTFVRRWQEYLVADLPTGYNLNVPTMLRDIANDNETTAFVPRSEVLARLTAYEARNPDNQPQATVQQLDAGVRAILQKTKRLDDLSESVGQLIALEQSITRRPSYTLSNSSLLRTALPLLDEINSRYLEFRNGLEVHLGLRSSPFGSSKIPEVEAVLLPLRMQLLKLALPRLLRAGEGEQPGADENAEQFLERFIQEARQSQDWTAALRGMEVRLALNPDQRSRLLDVQEQAVSAFRGFFSAVQFETAKSFEQAATAYFEALRSGQEGVPAAFIGERLATLQKEHPSEYQNSQIQVFHPSSAVAPTQPAGAASPQAAPFPAEQSYEAPKVSDDFENVIIPAAPTGLQVAPNPAATPGGNHQE